MARKPPSTQAAIASSLRSPASSRRPPIRLRSAADQRKVQAVTTNAAPVLVAARTAPPIAGPAKAATLSTVLEVTFAAVSSSGVRASEGTSADCAGRKAVATRATKDTSP